MFRDIPCSEVDRAISEAAREFSIDEQKFRKKIRCETGGTFNPFIGRYFKGLTQQHPGYWGGRVLRFNMTQEPDVLGNVLSPFDNARVGAWMASTDGWWHWPNC
jgi:hypothetical protein